VIRRKKVLPRIRCDLVGFSWDRLVSSSGHFSSRDHHLAFLWDDIASLWKRSKGEREGGREGVRVGRKEGGSERSGREGKIEEGTREYEEERT